MPACREAGTGPRDPGWAGLPRPEPGLGVKAGEPRRVAWVCSGDRSDRACAQSTAHEPLEPSPKRAPGSETLQVPFLCSGPRAASARRESGCTWARTRALGPGLGREAGVLTTSFLQLCGETCVCSLQPEGPAAPGVAFSTPRAAASGAERLGFAEEAGRTRDPTRLRQARRSPSARSGRSLFQASGRCYLLGNH